MHEKTEYYKKVKTPSGRNKYIKVSEYDGQFRSSLPVGTWVQVQRKNGMSRRYQIDPAIAPLIAASIILGDKIQDIVSSAASFGPPKSTEKEAEALTPEQIVAWENFRKAFGGLTVIQGKSIAEVSEEITSKLAEEASRLLQNETVKDAYDHFVFITKITQETLCHK